jgi:hypothetical protein
MAPNRLIRFFPLETFFALLILLAVACGNEAALTPSPSLAPTLSPTSTPEPISPEPIPTQVPPEEPEGATPPYSPSPMIEDITFRKVFIHYME